MFFSLSSPEDAVVWIPISSDGFPRFVFEGVASHVGILDVKL